ncbi:MULTISPECIES: hypothetical protein [Subtercola]|uniref:Hpt domain-containing protein n=1 Tax=Subtercola vilae TaxID=2056433 RepID=A0A4T2BIG8_9MICO|nr:MULTISPECIES: hypothetical protein [Subtercola]MEA9986501.1 hypothetical protein [Subtercola sp. RTI3]TIH29651.1 hypothetical protein D4765_17775 [Subtercola vilae]
MSQGTVIEWPVLFALVQQFPATRGKRSSFVDDFISMWEPRSFRLKRALSTGDLDDADVVLLSIESSGHMLGATTLEAIAGMVHTCVKKGDTAGAVRHLPRLTEVGHETCAELVRILGDG